jgi:hypothetical protein
MVNHSHYASDVPPHPSPNWLLQHDKIISLKVLEQAVTVKKCHLSTLPMQPIDFSDKSHRQHV